MPSTQDNLDRLIAAVRTQHQDDGHREKFKWCLHPACKVAAEIELMK